MEGFDGMYDWRLKPQLLRDVLESNFPDEKKQGQQPCAGPLQLSSALSVIRRHKLLRETVHDESWNAAFDAWNERILLYASSKLSDRCWAGICMVGVTSQDCTAKRFIENYATWFQKLLVLLKPPIRSPFLRMAACASLSDILTRLGTFLSIKKEGVSLSTKLVQPLLQLLGEDDSEIASSVADLFATILRVFPSSVQQHSDYAESILVSKMLSGRCSAEISQKLAQCLSLLPKVRGDGDSWFSLIQKVILAINDLLNDAFQGFEDVNKANEAVAALLPPGKDHPIPLGGHSVAAEAPKQTSKTFWHLLLPRVSSLMHCCSLMLTNPYPVQVVVPLGPLLVLVSRIINVNGLPYQQPMTLILSSQQALLCSELPGLHSCALDLLFAILKGVRSQLLPRAANIVRLLTEYFKGCVLPPLRVKLYTIARSLLHSMGVGMASYLAPAIIENTRADLKGSSCGSIVGGAPNISVKTNVSCAENSGFVQPTNSRKRKHSGSHQSDFSIPAESDNSNAAVPVSVQTAALLALEALLTVGGALRSDRWRLEVDFLVITVASNICATSPLLAYASSSSSYYCPEDASSYDGFDDIMLYTIPDLQIAAYKALLASLLSPTCHRPTYLSQGLSLFRKGKQECGTELAQFCAHALLALEPLIHPRSLPFTNVPSVPARGSYNTSYSPHLGGRQQQKHFANSGAGASPCVALPFGSSITKMVEQQQNQLSQEEEEDDDDVYLGWLGNGDEPNAEQEQQQQQQDELLNNNTTATTTDIPIDIRVDSFTETGDLQCCALDEITNITSSQCPINNANSIPLESLANNASTLINSSAMKTLDEGLVEMMDTANAEGNNADPAEESIRRLQSNKERQVEVDDVGTSIAESERDCPEKLMRVAVNEGPEIHKDSNDDAACIHHHIDEGKIHTEHNKTALLMRDNQTAAQEMLAFQEPEPESESKQKPSSAVPRLDIRQTSSIVETDSDAIPEIVDCDPDTD